jgi:hypothetical protein
MERTCPYHEAWNGETLAQPGLPSVVEMEAGGTETQQLIRRLSKENPLWGAERIWEVLC